MVFKKSSLGLEKAIGLGLGLTGLGLEKIGGLGLVTWWSCYITELNIADKPFKLLLEHHNGLLFW